MAASPRAAMLYYAGCEDRLYEPHFLQSCFLCSRPLGFNADIFMYRGDTAFCSKECRQEQIEFDDGKETSRKRSPSSSSFSSSSRATRKSESAKSDKAVRTGTVAVA